jgi:hypothetical protein
MKLSNILSLNYESYNQETKSYQFKRDAGLYANLVWVIRKIALLELNGYKVESVELILDEYNGEEAFDLFFEKNNNQIDYSNISDKDKSYFEQYLITSAFGLGIDDVKHLNFNITNQVIDKFFTPKESIVSYYNNLMYSNNIDINNTVFVWARSTDKSGESRIPDTSAYIGILNTLNLEGKEILIQTDDYRVLNDFKGSNLKFKTIPQIPMSNNLIGFHNELKDIRDDKFISIYNITKQEYLIQMYCLSLIGRDSYKTILYPGNPTTYIPIIKKSFDNCYLFKDNAQLF